MADQKINALPVKTSPTTGDKMLMIGSAEEYQIDYDQLATAILNKLTSKTFALDQGTKTLVAALNELNSNCLKGWVLKIKKVENEQINNTIQTSYFKTGLPLFNTVPICFKETYRNGYVYLFWKYTNVDDSNWLVHVLGENVSGAFSGDIYYLEKI